jgi:DNA-binding transcriptional LysR family regulator
LTSRLKIRDLELIVALHEEGTFTQAAKRVGVTEPALSKRLLLIERMVQARLFDRGHDGATITGAGRHFVEHIQESVHSFHRAVHEARERKPTPPRASNNFLEVGYNFLDLERRMRAVMWYGAERLIGIANGPYKVLN